MQTPNPLRQRLYQGQHALGFSLSYPSPGAIECIGAGWDWVWIDNQHGQYDYRSTLECVRAADACGVAPVVRTSGHEYGLIGPVMDMDVAGIMVPMVNSVDEARQVVRAVRFPPLGERSFGGRRAVELHGRDYCYKANEEVVLILQIETPQALEQAEAIAAVEGVDALFFGAEDYKLRRGIPLSTRLLESDEVLHALDVMAGAARNSGKASGAIAATATELRRMMSAGCLLNCGGSDVQFLKLGSQQRLSELRAISE
jgi:4-hydroxy-2-oxoheptanedioate aldolase